ncbi:pimeloyl-ACP methyl ester carboxylesterase [Nocardia tenerifensis]|uniref:Pimeloyl-ACP methyl ester carboxylesterase n=1 Tax=Nocardia tenerifensis TaxID=228006 RepID=A0A318JSX5_9NOCA|nr:epoxide hydrolase family protein [Nocardia tenerifensis]PXX59334.1 pimeloyl-ACP methyl ester carboxylesterase [Nocardia tenerifensis]
MTNTAITPFRIDIPQAELDELRDRLRHARLPHPVPGTENDWGRGIAPAYLAELARYWRDDFDWRAQEARLNAHDQFTTEIDGQTIHFIHVRSAEPDAAPLLITHGYPGSVVEFLDVIGPLTDPVAHGGAATDAFHVVIPSLPGFGFSTPLASTGWELSRTTEAFAELMTRLGYEKFAAQGGDVGAGVTGRLAALYPERVIATHVNSDRGSLGLVGEQLPMPDGLTAEELAAIEEAQERWAQQKGYLVLQSTQPNAIAAALTDSPIAQLAWIAEKFQVWSDPARSTGEAVDRDLLLANISIYWFTRSGASAAQFLWETAHSGMDWVMPSGVPQGWAVFNTSPLMSRVMNPGGHIEHFTEYTEGGHFAALSEPVLFVADVRTFFRDHRG